MTDNSDLRAATKLVHLGRKPEKYGGLVNPPVMRGSTILFSSCAAMQAAESHWHDQPYYGRHGNDATFAFEQAIADLEGGYRAVAVESGLAAITAAISAFVKAGDHLLMTDAVYGPTRKFCDSFLRRFDVETTYYDPRINPDKLAALIRPNTRVLFMESPGSLTFEMEDIRGLADAARQAGVVSMMDNTWATPLYCKPLSLGVDVVVHAATKYIVGHSDAMLGVIVSNERHYMTLRQSVAVFGHHAAPDDIYLAQRGLRSMAARLQQQSASAMQIARWLQQQSAVQRVLYPALPDDPGHALWNRDYTGASGLFAFVLQPAYDRAAMQRLVDGVRLFGIGFSWGGYESLILPVSLGAVRSATQWQGGEVVRLSVGLEDPLDLIDDLAIGFAALEAST